MGRTSSHRLLWTDNVARWVAKKTYHLTKVMRPGHVLRRILAAMRPLGHGAYAIPPDLVIEARDAVEDFVPYADDTEGKVWQ